MVKLLELLKTQLSAARVFYVVKANSKPTLLRHLAELGSNFDAASAGELYLLHDVSVISGERILLTHPTKTPMPFL